MYHEKVAVIHAYDHYSTDQIIEDSCVAEFVGIIVEDYPHYVKIKHITADISRAGSAQEFHVIFRFAIKRMWTFELTQLNEMSEEEIKLLTRLRSPDETDPEGKYLEISKLTLHDFVKKLNNSDLYSLRDQVEREMKARKLE